MAVAPHNLLRRSARYDKVIHLIVLHGELNSARILRCNLPVSFSGGIQKQPVTLCGKVKRNVDIGAVAGGANGVLVDKVNRSAVTDNAVKTLAETVNDFIIVKS